MRICRACAVVVFDDPGVRFRADGTWSSLNACNGGYGRWVMGPGGSLATTGGPTTLIDCPQADAHDWVSTASVAAFNGEQLVLIEDQDLDPATDRMHRLGRLS